MNDKIIKDVKGNMNSFVELLAINADAAEKLINQQAALATDLLKQNVGYAKGLVECKDVKAVVEANQAWGREVGEKTVEAGKANLAVFEEARTATAGVVEGLVKSAQGQVEASVKELRSKVEASVADAKAQVEESIKTVQGQVSKAAKKAA